MPGDSQCVFNDIPAITEALRNVVNIVTGSGGLADMSSIITGANSALDAIDNAIANNIQLSQQCINRFKNINTEKKYDDINTSQAMLENSQLTHKEIIYSRIQIIIYIIALLYFYKLILSE